MWPATLLDPIWWQKLLSVTTHSLIFSLISSVNFSSLLISHTLSIYIFPHLPALLYSSTTFWLFKMRSLPCLEMLETNNTLMRHHILGEQISQNKNSLVHQIWGSHGSVLRFSPSGRETLCSLVDMHNYFGGTCCLLHLRKGISFLSNSFCSKPSLHYHILNDSKIISF